MLSQSSLNGSESSPDESEAHELEVELVDKEDDKLDSELLSEELEMLGAWETVGTPTCLSLLLRIRCCLCLRLNREKWNFKKRETNNLARRTRRIGSGMVALHLSRGLAGQY